MIASRYNAQFKELKSLLEPRGAKKSGNALVAGRKIVPELYPSAVVVVGEDGHWPEDLPQTTKIIWLERSLFKDLDVFGTHYPLLVVPIPESAAWVQAPPVGLELVLSLQDPSNLGAILRSAEAFGVRQVILLKECASPFHPKAIRSSSGSCFRIPFAEGPSLKDFSDENAFALDMKGDPLSDFKWPTNCRLIIGEEGQGLPANFTGRSISIPMKIGMDSLNASIAASIALFSYKQQH